MKTALRAILAAFALIGILALVLALFRLPVIPSLSLLFQGAFGDRFGWSRTAVKSTPLLLTGLGMVVAWRAKMYNIGGEGQYVLGGIAGAWAAKCLVGTGMPGPLITMAVLVATIAGGSMWAWVAGWLYVRRGVEVVISTILLNFIALQLLAWAVSGPLQEKARKLPLSDNLPEGVMLPKWDRQMELHAGVIIAIFAAIAVYAYLFLTKAGYKLRLVGENAQAARANRIPSGRVHLQAMLVSGGLCGLAGGIDYTGLSGQLSTGFAQGWGFLGIPVALLAGLHPLLALPSAAFFGALFAGSQNLAQFTKQGTTLIYVVQAAVVLGVVSMRAWADRQPATEAQD